MGTGNLGDQASDVELFQPAADGLCFSATKVGVGAIAVQALMNVFGLEAVQMIFTGQNGRKEIYVVLFGDVKAGVTTPGMLLRLHQLVNLRVVGMAVFDGCQRVQITQVG